MNEALCVLQKTCASTVATMIAVMEDAEAPAMVRLKAAMAVLETALKSRTVDELETRIAALAALAASDGMCD
jgi:hypothetical protein